MPKPKKARIANVHSGPRGGDAAAAATKEGKGNNKKMHTFPRLSTSNNNNNNNPNTNSNSNVNKNKQKQQQQQRKTIIPFGKGDRVLLIGEGEFYYIFELCVYVDKIKSQVTSPLPTLWSSSIDAGMYLQLVMTAKMLCIASIRKRQRRISRISVVLFRRRNGKI